MAADGVGTAGRVDDRYITFFCFGVIAFFAILVTVLSLIQGKLDAKKDLFRRTDAAPVSAASGLGCGTIIVIAVVIIFLMIILSTCSSSSGGSGYRSSGGSYGGYSSGGGHK